MNMVVHMQDQMAAAIGQLGPIGQFDKRKQDGPIKETPVTHLEGALATLRSAAVAVSRVSDALVGEQSAKEACGQRIDSGGMLGKIIDMSSDVERLAKSIIEDIARIERRL